MRNMFTCPQTGERVYCQSAKGHVGIAFSCAKGIVQLEKCLKSAHWSEGECEDISKLIAGHERSIIAHANAIIAGAFN